MEVGRVPFGPFVQSLTVPSANRCRRVHTRSVLSRGFRATNANSANSPGAMVIVQLRSDCPLVVRDPWYRLSLSRHYHMPGHRRRPLPLVVTDVPVDHWCLDNADCLDVEGRREGDAGQLCGCSAVQEQDATTDSYGAPNPPPPEWLRVSMVQHLTRGVVASRLAPIGQGFAACQSSRTARKDISRFAASGC